MNDADYEEWKKTDEWAKLMLDPNTMRFLEILYANGEAGIDYPFKRTPEYEKARSKGLVESVTGSRDTHVIRFTKIGAKFMLRYMPGVKEQEDFWWLVRPAPHMRSEERDVVVAYQLIIDLIVKLGFMGMAERQALLMSVKNIDDEYRPLVEHFVNAVFAENDKEK